MADPRDDDVADSFDTWDNFADSYGCEDDQEAQDIYDAFEAADEENN